MSISKVYLMETENERNVLTVLWKCRLYDEIYIFYLFEIFQTIEQYSDI